MVVSVYDLCSAVTSFHNPSSTRDDATNGMTTYVDVSGTTDVTADADRIQSSDVDVTVSSLTEITNHVTTELKPETGQSTPGTTLPSGKSKLIHW